MIVVFDKIKGIDPRMIANNITPFEPVHPGELLKGEIEYRGISQGKLATQMGIAYKMLNNILNERRPISTTTAMLFEAALGIDAGLLIRMQADYNLQVATQDKTLAIRIAKIRQMASML